MWRKLIRCNGQRCGKYDVAWAMQGKEAGCISELLQHKGKGCESVACQIVV